jgi:thiol-disulfide isomerase/thioredoxin
MSIKLKMFSMALIAALISAPVMKLFAQTETVTAPGAVAPSLDKLKTAVEANPNDIKAISAYYQTFNESNPGHQKDLFIQFQTWVKQFPKAGYLPIFLERAKKAAAVTTDENVLEKLKLAVEAAPDSLSRHNAYIEAIGPDNPEVATRYDALIKEFPKCAVVPYALAKVYIDQESPKAKPYLLKAVAIDPKYGQAWADLWMDAQRWGDFNQGWKYLEKAMAADPSNADYAFSYATSFMGLDQDKFTALSLKIAKDFPNSDKGVRALGYLASRSSEKDQIKYYQLLHDSFPPNVSGGYMGSYFYLLLAANPEKAESLATEMKAAKQGGGTNWSGLAEQAEFVIQGKKLLDQNKPGDALVVFSKVKVPRYALSANKSLFLLKSEAIDQMGNHSAAYDTIMKAFVKVPSTIMQEALYRYGEKSGKTEAAVKADIYKKLEANAKEATPFTLKKYIGEGSTSLADYKGKVTLLTYWFPGCGPCRGEMPFFENVVKQYKKRPLVYVGINIDRGQDDYVLPFHKSSGFSFTPLADVSGRIKGNLDNKGAAPVNFLIDQNGRIIFSDFSIHAENEADLKLMVDLLLNAPDEFTKNK